MRSLPTISLALLTALVLSGCSPMFEALNGKEVLREETWTRSDGADCMTQWTLVVTSGLDTEDGPIGDVRDAFANAEPSVEQVDAATREAVEGTRDESGMSSEAATLGAEAAGLAEALHASAVDDLEARGRADQLHLYELNSESTCS